MKILSIDPGPVFSAFVKWETENSTILSKGKVLNSEMMRIVKEDEYDEFIIEKMQCLGMAVGESVFETSYFIGRLLERANPLSIGFVRTVQRGKIKMHHCGSMRAKDANIRQALIDRLGEPGTKKAPGATFGVSADIWSALAIALYHADTRQEWTTEFLKNVLQS